jgi:2-dehydro-3-deoxygluconokinase
MWNVDTSHLKLLGKRIGLYYLETGTLQRPAEIIYDREGSSFATTPPEIYDWHNILKGARWFHTSGINPALSPQVASATREAITVAKNEGIPVSFDLNYRRKLWDPTEARQSLEKLLPKVDLLIAGRGQIEEVLGIGSQKDDFEATEDIACKTAITYGISKVCIPRRGMGEGLLETRSAVFFDGSRCHRSPWMAFEMIEPIGGGDAFAGALISSLLSNEEPQRAAEIAVAAACVKHSIPGDFLKAREEEILAFLENPSQRGIRR